MGLGTTDESIVVIRDEDNLEKDLIRVDDCLWYWEFQTTKGEWNKTSWRYTKKRAKSVLLHSEQATLTPLYALGFRLPKEN